MRPNRGAARLHFRELLTVAMLTGATASVMGSGYTVGRYSADCPSRRVSGTGGIPVGRNLSRRPPLAVFYIIYIMRSCWFRPAGPLRAFGSAPSHGSSQCRVPRVGLRAPSLPLHAARLGAQRAKRRRRMVSTPWTALMSLRDGQARSQCYELPLQVRFAIMQPGCPSTAVQHAS